MMMRRANVTIIRKRRAAALAKRAAKNEDGDQKTSSFGGNIGAAFTQNPKSVESAFWIIFVMLFAFVASFAQGDDGFAYDMTNEIRVLYSDFMNIAKISDWWDFISGQYLDTTYQDAWYNNDVLSGTDLGLVNFEFLIIGPVYVRQLRVRNNSCKSRYKFNTTDQPLCFADFSASSEDRKPYGPPDNSTGLPSFRYSTSKQLGCVAGCYTSGFMGVYPVAGFLETLPTPAGNSSRDAAAARIADLKEGRWIDRGTRVLYAEFSL